MSILALFEGKSTEEIGEMLTKEVDEFVRSRLEEAFNEALDGEIEEFMLDSLKSPDSNIRNGYYERHLKTKFGLLGIRIPRDRMSLFRTRLLKPYQRVTEDLESAVQKLYLQGLTLSEITSFLRESSDLSMSDEAARRLVAKLAKDAEEFRARPLPRCPIVMLDGTYVPIRRRYGDSSSVSKECIEVALGITEDGRRVILGFRTIPNEGSSSWSGFLEGLKARGIGDPRLFVTDGLSGMPEAIESSFPSAVHQRCLVHVQRNIAQAVRVRDRAAIMSDFRLVYSQPEPKSTDEAFASFVAKWAKPYPRLMQRLVESQDSLFAYLDFPECMRNSIRTSNAIESFNACLKRMTRRRVIMNSEGNALTVIAQVIREYEQNSRPCAFLRHMTEEEKAKLGFK